MEKKFKEVTKKY